MGDSSPPDYRVVAIEAALTDAEQRGEAPGYRRGLERAVEIILSRENRERYVAQGPRIMQYVAEAILAERDRAKEPKP